MINMDFKTRGTSPDCKTVLFILGFILPNLKRRERGVGSKHLTDVPLCLCVTGQNKAGGIEEKHLLHYRLQGQTGHNHVTGPAWWLWLSWEIKTTFRERLTSGTDQQSNNQPSTFR